MGHLLILKVYYTYIILFGVNLTTSRAKNVFLSDNWILDVTRFLNSLCTFSSAITKSVWFLDIGLIPLRSATFPLKKFLFKRQPCAHQVVSQTCCNAWLALDNNNVLNTFNSVCFNWNYFYFNLLFKPEHGWVPATLVMNPCGPNGPSPPGKNWDNPMLFILILGKYG